MGKKLNIGLVALGLIPLILFGFSSGLVFAEENMESKPCIDVLGLFYEVVTIEKRSDITQEWLENLNICEQRLTGPAVETLKINFGLTENSIPEDYEKVAKVLKDAAKSDSGFTQILMLAVGGVPAMVQSIKTKPPRNGDAEAQYLLGYIYANGLTGKVEEKKAKKFLERAAAQEHSQAITLLQTMTSQDE